LEEVIRRETPEVEVLKTDEIKAALELALDLVGDEGMVLVTGSLYMLGDARSLWYPVDQILMDLEQAN
jgi:folylpolyglutamate synthase/dihydropteroate synthase